MPLEETVTELVNGLHLLRRVWLEQLEEWSCHFRRQGTWLEKLVCG